MTIMLFIPERKRFVMVVVSNDRQNSVLNRTGVSPLVAKIRGTKKIQAKYPISGNDTPPSRTGNMSIHKSPLSPASRRAFLFNTFGCGCFCFFDLFFDFLLEPISWGHYRVFESMSNYGSDFVLTLPKITRPKTAKRKSSWVAE